MLRFCTCLDRYYHNLEHLYPILVGSREEQVVRLQRLDLDIPSCRPVSYTHLTDAVAELKEKKVPENLIKMEEEESSESEPGTILRQSPAAGTTYDLSKASTITLTVAKKVTSVSMPSYIGSSLEFTKNNLTQIVGVKEANIEVVEVSTAPEGTAEGTVVDQTPKAGEQVDLASTRIKLSIYKPKTPVSYTHLY